MRAAWEQFLGNLGKRGAAPGAPHAPKRRQEREKSFAGSLGRFFLVRLQFAATTTTKTAGDRSIPAEKGMCLSAKAFLKGLGTLWERLGIIWESFGNVWGRLGTFENSLGTVRLLRTVRFFAASSAGLNATNAHHEHKGRTVPRTKSRIEHRDNPRFIYVPYAARTLIFHRSSLRSLPAIHRSLPTSPRQHTTVYTCCQRLYKNGVRFELSPFLPTLSVARSSSVRGTRFS